MSFCLVSVYLFQLLKQASNELDTSHSEDVSHLKRLIQVLDDFYFSKEDVSKILFVKPKVLELSKNKLQKQLKGFLTLHFPHDVIKSMVIKCPSLLLID